MVFERKANNFLVSTMNNLLRQVKVYGSFDDSKPTIFRTHVFQKWV